MSEFSVNLVRVEKFGKHPHADTLSITDVDGCPCIFKTGDFAKGDLAVYIPIESVLKLDTPVGKTLSFLKWKKNGTFRVKAKRLCNIFSMGILVGANKVFSPDELSVLSVGQNLSERLSIEKCEEVIPAHLSGLFRKDPQIRPFYDIESYRKYKEDFVAGEPVIISEKIHGCNFSCGVARDNETQSQSFYVFCHRRCLKETETNAFWQVARKYYLESFCGHPLMDNRVLYGEMYGAPVNDLSYGKRGLSFVAFDIWDRKLGRYLDHEMFTHILHTVNCSMGELKVEAAPLLYEGPYSDSIVNETLYKINVQSALASNNNFVQIGEGIVVKAAKERYRTSHGGRTQLKFVGENYLLRKNAQEGH